ncbi:MAG TPA: hypothetical protein VF868_15240 [Bacteroidia bacterium]|jgi:hypothetical protein
MAISYNSVDIKGVVFEPIIEEILFENNTIKNSLVDFVEDVKAETIFTENINSVTQQPYTSGTPTSSGTFSLVDTVVTPVKVMYYHEFDTNTLRATRFKRDMKAGAWNTASTEFEKVVLGNYGTRIGLDAESKFWNSASSATKTAVAALTAGTTQSFVGAAEKTYVAAAPASEFDGVITRMIYNAGGVGARIKVAGTTITSSNIATEYQKVYAAIPAAVLNGVEAPFIYAPYSHKQLINSYNIAATYRDLFTVDIKGDTYFYNGIEIKFVPIAENTLVAAIWSHIKWCTDSMSDLNTMKIDKIAANQDKEFLKVVFSQYAHVVNQAFNVLYLG